MDTDTKGFPGHGAGQMPNKPLCGSEWGEVVAVLKGTQVQTGINKKDLQRCVHQFKGKKAQGTSLVVQWSGVGAFFLTAVDTQVQSLVGELRSCKRQDQKKKKKKKKNGRKRSFSNDRVQPLTSR